MTYQAKGESGNSVGFFVEIWLYFPGLEGQMIVSVLSNVVEEESEKEGRKSGCGSLSDQEMCLTVAYSPFVAGGDGVWKRCLCGCNFLLCLDA